MKVTNSVNAIPCRCASQLLLETPCALQSPCSIVEIYKVCNFNDIWPQEYSPGNCEGLATPLYTTKIT